MDHIKNKIEAILFTTGKSLKIQEIGQLCGIGSLGLVKDNLEALKSDYHNRNSSLELINESDRWKLGLRKEYLYLTEKLLTDSELDRPVQETLAVVAFKQPILQSDLIKIRGNSAYGHISLLKQESFITSEKSGRTRILKLTQKFYDYFDVVNDTLKLKLENSSNKPDTETIVDVKPKS